MSSENFNSEEESSVSDGEMEGDENLDGNVSDEEGIDLNMSVEGEEDAEPDNADVKVIFGKNRRNQIFKERTPAKISKSVKMKTDNSEEEIVSNGETSDDYSSSETDGEIELPIEMDNENEKQQDDNGKASEQFKLPDIQLPEGEPISVVSIKQEYDEDEEMYFRDEEMEEQNEMEEKKDDPSTEQQGNKSGKRKKAKPEVTEEDLTKINIRFSFVCQLCDEKCDNPASLTAHIQKSHADQIGTYMCATCQRVYQTVEHLRAHMLCHIQLGTYECPDCKKIYHHPASLVSHRRRWHRKEGEPHECKECGRTFNIRSDLNTHMKSHVQETFSCKYCEKAFRTDRYLRLHTRHVHFGHKHLKMECKICHKSFQKKSMVAHMKIHQVGKLHKCHYCGKCMTTQYSLMAHIRRHEGVKPFVCQICDKGFVDKGKLVRHIHSHSGTRDFQCEICNKTFSERQYLRQHRRIHEESKDYPCRICGTMFKSMNSVWSHMRKHTQSDRYKCKQCGKTCYRPDHLRSHMVSHTGVKEFQCEICSKRFAKSYDLTEHMRGHSGEKPYSCTLCDRAFARHGEFRKHKMSKYHREREIEAGLPPSFPTPPPRPAKGSARHQCGSCDKKFSTTSGLAAHLRRKSHVAKDFSREDTYHDAEGFEENQNDNEMQSVPVLQEIPTTHHNVNIVNHAMIRESRNDDLEGLNA